MIDFTSWPTAFCTESNYQKSWEKEIEKQLRSRRFRRWITNYNCKKWQPASNANAGNGRKGSGSSEACKNVHAFCLQQAPAVSIPSHHNEKKAWNRFIMLALLPVPLLRWLAGKQTIRSTTELSTTQYFQPSVKDPKKIAPWMCTQQLTRKYTNSKNLSRDYPDFQQKFWNRFF